MKLTLIKLLAAVCLVLFMGGSSMVEAGRSSTQREVRDLEGIRKIAVEVSSSRVDVIPTEKECLEVEYFERTGSADRKPWELVVEEMGSTVTVRLHDPNVRTLFNINFGRESRLTIYVPQQYYHALSITSSSGSINITDIGLSQLYLQASSGSITGDYLSAEKSELRSSSGSITIRGLNSSNALVHSSSGSVSIEDFRGNLNVRTSSGSSRIEFEEVGNLQAEASSGNITVILPWNSEFRVNSSVSSGTYTNEFPVHITYSSRSNRETSGTVGENPSALIDLRTSSGSITVKRSR